MAEQAPPLVALVNRFAHEFEAVEAEIFDAISSDAADVADGGDLMNAVLAATPAGFARECIEVIAHRLAGFYGWSQLDYNPALRKRGDEIAGAYVVEHGEPVVVGRAP